MSTGLKKTKTKMEKKNYKIMEKGLILVWGKHKNGKKFNFKKPDKHG